MTTIFTPGHAPGHHSFLVRLPKSKPIILAVDAAYTTDHWEERSLPGFLSSTVDSVRSVQKLRTVAEKTGAMVVTGHDPDAWSSFKKAPDFYAQFELVISIKVEVKTSHFLHSILGNSYI